MKDPGARVLVVDDEPAIQRFLRTALSAEGYSVFAASNGADALTQAIAHRPDLIILDLGLPDMDGSQVTRRVREWSSVPIIILSVRGQEADKIEALDAGADDYLIKPFSVGELLARMRVGLRRTTPSATGLPFVSGNLSVDLTRRVVTVAGNEVRLTPTEYDILRVLVTHAGLVLTHRQLLMEVWGAGYEQEAHMLRVNVSNLRRKIEADPSRPRHVVTEPGVGYRLTAEDYPRSRPKAE